ncbi:unnamed protein product [Didymodactylos carnosus]|uniref:NAD(P)(+)--arginine ADP-ribosyltransferase n=1 Tax=Didymodactylos carnosus TaxID=1234261 RepID=A0A814LJC7_9BILA|nr:unnamed protein product [Didymodactylos carnosus]CAF1066583.1 unnamed protein product [Didymodactylos carnosus]CAF3663465.1 unnamed protein product [Didymodactylos carnosus]CAF3834183.1 unnamed protein product [Didymodactylos carnosus]
MLDCCRYHYRNNPSQLRLIDEFDERYKSEHAISWYTRDSFLYRIINKALRTENIDALIRLRYFIIDVCTMLKLKHDEQQQQQQKSKVYRGLKLTDAEIEQLKLNIGRIISRNGFLSTTPSSTIAEMFAANVIFEIEINKLLSEQNNIIYADISSLSYMQDEEEILFDLGTIFRVISVTYSDNRRLWIVSLVTIADDDDDV